MANLLQYDWLVSNQLALGFSSRNENGPIERRKMINHLALVNDPSRDRKRTWERNIFHNGVIAGITKSFRAYIGADRSKAKSKN